MYLFSSFIAGIVLYFLFLFFPFSSLILSITASVALGTRRKFLYILILLSGAFFCFLRDGPAPETPYIRGEIDAQGFFRSIPTRTAQGSFSQSFVVEAASHTQTRDDLPDLQEQAIFLISDEAHEPGTECKAQIRLLPPRQGKNPGQMRQEKTYGKITGIACLKEKKSSPDLMLQRYRYRIDRSFQNIFQKDSAAFLSAITTGERGHIDEQLRNAFNTAGLAHLLSISGTHFGLFSLFLFGSFRFVIHRLPYPLLQRLTLMLTPSQAAAIFCLPFMLGYLAISGSSIPAIRSFIMVGLFLLGLIIGRKGLWLNSLLLAACLILLWDPRALLDLSFQLSFLAVLCIGFILDFHKEREPGESRIMEYLRGVLLITLAASIGTGPLVAYHFHYASLISPLTNLVIAPLIGFILIPLTLFSSFLSLITGYLILSPVISVIADFSILSIQWISTIPFADMKIPAFPPVLLVCFYAGLLLYLITGKNKYVLLLPLLTFSIYFMAGIVPERGLSVTFLDVGQGDSSVIELPDGKTVVVDTGSTGFETSSYLKYRDITDIDALVLSHVHPDHSGGLKSLTERFRVHEIWDNGKTVFPVYACRIPRRSLSRGDVIEGKGYRILVLHPYKEFYTMYGKAYQEENNDSLVFRLQGDSASFLFTGDIEQEAADDILHLGGWLRSDVMKVPHHGSRTSAHGQLVTQVSPGIAVISVALHNSFGHPHSETLHILQNARILRTNSEGSIKGQETHGVLKVKNFKDFELQKTLDFPDEVKNLKKLFMTW